MAKRRGIQILNAPQTQLEDPKRDFTTVWVPRRTGSGVRVTQENALTYSAVWASVRVISETIASLGWKLFERQNERGKRVVTGTPVSNVLERPCPEMTPFTFRETVTAWALTWGNGYAEIERDPSGRPKWLWPISPDRVEVTRDTGNNLVYIIHNNDGSSTLIQSPNMFHVKGLGTGLMGYSVIAFAARSLGLSIAAEEFGSSFFGNGATIGGVLKYPGELDPDGRKNIRESWSQMYQGPYNASRTAILEEGMDYQQLGIPPEDAQFLETRKFQISDVARWFRVPPHKLADLERATFSNIEEQNIDFTTDTIVPWAMRWEQEADSKLVGRQNRVKQYTKLNLNSLLRGAIDKRYDAYTKGRQWGWLSPNDVREFEDMNPLPSDQGDVYLSPSNMVKTEDLGKEPEAPEFIEEDNPENNQDNNQDNNQENMRNVYLGMISNGIKRCLLRECNRAKRTPVKVKSSKDFIGWMGDFYDTHNQYLIETLTPIAESMCNFAELEYQNVNGVTIFDSFISSYADKYCNESLAEICNARDEGALSSFYERAESAWPDEIAGDIFSGLVEIITMVKS